MDWALAALARASDSQRQRSQGGIASIDVHSSTLTVRIIPASM
jgi:hypothetical protein